MPTFRYSAIDHTGRPYAGSLEAENLEAVRTKLAELRYHIVNINEVASSTNASDFFKRFNRVKPKELVVFSRQFATMIDAGLSVLKCLDILQRQSKDPVLREALAAVRHDVNGGSSLTDGMSKHPRVFSKLYVNMIRSAEAGGILDQVLDRLATFLEKEQEMRQKVRSAMMYPTVVFFVAMIVMGVLMWWVLPQFQRIFKEMGLQQLPLSTQLMLNFSHVTRQYWYIVLMLIAGVFAGYKVYARTETGALHIDELKLRIPVFGDIILKVAISRFARTFGTLISSGVPVLRALEITMNTADNLAVSQVIARARNSVKEGEKISTPMHSSSLFPIMVTQMIAVGEETGRLDQMLVKVSDFYEAEVDATLKGLASLIEPIMIVGLGIMVGFIAVSVITPIYTVVQNVR
ncbi:MAG TPA: type II secretion system F family protein [Armatimonadota bacterium]|nr:type II secretion system F family protein [Armatimonadota bacterium]